ncbi:MAG: class I SAM-dependent methyltransferase [Candidatus Omnitrophota bacterium]
MNNRNPSEIKSWAEWFDRRARYYSDPLAKIAYYVDGKLLPVELMGATLQDAFDKLRAASECRLLDVGGGVGLFASTFRSKFKRIITTDISFAMVKDGKRLSPNDNFIVTSAVDLPFKSCSFERLLCYSVFQYFQDLYFAKEVLSEFIRVVKKGGLILIGDIIPSQAQQKKEMKKQDNKQNPYYPPVLKHDLKMLEFKNEFFLEFCNENGISFRVLKQNIKGKPASISRYDVLIET